MDSAGYNLRATNDLLSDLSFQVSLALFAQAPIASLFLARMLAVFASLVQFG